MSALSYAVRQMLGGSGSAGGVLDTSKPTAVFQAQPRRYRTLSVALPSSIISNAQTHDLKAALAGQIARALAVFCVDEIVVFDDGQATIPRPSDNLMTYANNNQYGSTDSRYTGFANPHYFLTHLLSFLECPPHLRMHLFSLHPDLRTTGALPSLDIPHHMRAHEWCRYREGVTVEDFNLPPYGLSDSPIRSNKEGKSRAKNPVATTLVNVGFQKPVCIPGNIPLNTRVTVKLSAICPPPNFQTANLTGEAVRPTEPRERTGYYWGYNVRFASSISNIFTECTYDQGYDLSFGTSERGVPLSSITTPPGGELRKHMLIVFGGVAGLEAAAKADTTLWTLGMRRMEDLFDHWVNLCPAQGSRTIRTEEALWLGLMGLRGAYQ